MQNVQKSKLSWVSTAVAIAALVGTIFGIGYNWRRFEEVQARQDGTARALTESSQAAERDYMRKDVASEQYKALVEQITQLRQLIERKDRQ